MRLFSLLSLQALVLSSDAIPLQNNSSILSCTWETPRLTAFSPASRRVLENAKAYCTRWLVSKAADILIEVLENVKAADTLIEVEIFYSLSLHMMGMTLTVDSVDFGS